jgi:prevent-host-death family protein
MNLKAKVKPITYLKNHTKELVKDVSEEGKTVMITQNGEAKVVIMDVETYDRWRDAMAILKMLAQSEGDMTKGRVIPQREAFKRAEIAIQKAVKDD